jgi:hypothetical protein
MKRYPVLSLLAAGAVAAVLVGSVALAGSYGAKDAPAKSAHKAVQTEYLVESPHTADGCVQALDEISAMGPNALAKWQFGCMAGEHVGWAIVTAPNEQAALQLVPASLRDKARVHKLNKFSAAQVKALHGKMK